MHNFRCHTWKGPIPDDHCSPRNPGGGWRRVCKCLYPPSPAPTPLPTWSPTPSPTPAPCTTIGKAGVGAGYDCDFPFKHSSTTFYGCTVEDSVLPWCYVDVDQDGNGLAGRWGHCGPDCAMAPPPTKSPTKPPAAPAPTTPYPCTSRPTTQAPTS